MPAHGRDDRRWTEADVVRWLDEVEPELETRDPFAWLELTPAAPPAKIQPAYHAIARNRHPDLHRTRLSPADFDRLVRVYARVTAAYADLRDPVRCEEIGRALRARARRAAGQGPAVGEPPPAPMAAPSRPTVSRLATPPAPTSPSIGRVATPIPGHTQPSIGRVATPIPGHTQPSVSRVATPQPGAPGQTRPSVSRVATPQPGAPGQTRPSVSRVATPQPGAPGQTRPSVSRVATPQPGQTQPSIPRVATPASTRPGVPRVEPPAASPSPAPHRPAAAPARAPGPTPPTLPTPQGTDARPRTAAPSVPPTPPAPRAPGMPSLPPLDPIDPARAMNPRALACYRRAEGALQVGDRTTALLQIRMALAADPSSELLRAALAELLGL